VTIVIRAPGQAPTSLELPASKVRRRPPPFVKGGRRTIYELAAAIAATGRRIELRGQVLESVFEEICAAAGARPVLDPAPRMPTADDTVIVAESWPDLLYAPYHVSGARCIMMLLAPPGLVGWPYTAEPWSKPDPLTVDPEAVGRPQHFRAIAGLGFEMWTHSRGLQSAAVDAGAECAWLGSGKPRPFPNPVPKEHDLVVLEHNRWAPLANRIAEECGHETLRVPRADNDVVIRNLGSARVLVWPSRIEGPSRVQVEARAMGTVPVALSSNRFAEGLGSDGGSVVVDSIEEMVPTIRELLARPDELQRLSSRAIETARAQVDWDAYVERVDRVLSEDPPPRDGAAARERIAAAMARNELRLQTRIAELEWEAQAGERRRSGLRLLRRRHRPAPARRPKPRPAEPTVYVAGGYLPKGGGHMAYHVGRIAAARSGRRCRIVTMKGETAASSTWTYPQEFDALSREQMELEIGDEDLLIANPSFSRNQFGLRLPGRKLMYVQGFASLPVIDGFFDDYVCASDFLQDLLSRTYGIEAPVIPPFVQVDRVPPGPAWDERPADRMMVMTKAFGEQLLERFDAVMRSDHPAVEYGLSVTPALSHVALLERMSQHRYFLTLSPSEGFGLAQLEAMAAGATVAGFHGGGGTHFMRPGHNCEAVSYPAMEELCERVAALLSDPGSARRLAEKGRETALEYDLPRFEASWEAHFDALFGG